MNRRPFLKSLLAVLGAPLVGWRKPEMKYLDSPANIITVDVLPKAGFAVVNDLGQPIRYIPGRFLVGGKEHIWSFMAPEVDVAAEGV